MHKLTTTTTVWIVLLLATACSLWAAEFGSFALTPRLANAVILLAAFFKVRLVILHFMEVATAPIALRIVFELWVVLTAAALLYQLCFQ